MCGDTAQDEQSIRDQTRGLEIGSALKQLHGESKMSILLVEQYLDFCKELADTFAIMERGAVVCAGTVDALTDDVVKKYLTV